VAQQLRQQCPSDIVLMLYVEYRADSRKQLFKPNLHGLVCIRT